MLKMIILLQLVIVVSDVDRSDAITTKLISMNQIVEPGFVYFGDFQSSWYQQ